MKEKKKKKTRIIISLLMQNFGELPIPTKGEREYNIEKSNLLFYLILLAD